MVAMDLTRNRYDAVLLSVSYKQLLCSSCNSNRKGVIDLPDMCPGSSKLSFACIWTMNRKNESTQLDHTAASFASFLSCTSFSLDVGPV